MDETMTRIVTEYNIWYVLWNAGIINSTTPADSYEFNLVAKYYPTSLLEESLSCTYSNPVWKIAAQQELLERSMLGAVKLDLPEYVRKPRSKRR